MDVEEMKAATIAGTEIIIRPLNGKMVVVREGRNSPAPGEYRTVNPFWAWIATNRPAGEPFVGLDDGYKAVVYFGESKSLTEIAADALRMCIGDEGEVTTEGGKLKISLLHFSYLKEVYDLLWYVVTTIPNLEVQTEVSFSVHSML